ncbi:MAG: hypothetical protein SVM79_07300 [Chloroflexota bacterium]|nr:hypothetical protein [Chloroflexota bacterium]
MRKLIHSMMVLVLILSCATLAACGGEEGEQSQGTASNVTSEETMFTSEETSDVTVTATPPTATGETPATGGGTSGEGCSGVPRYPGASEVEEGWSWGASQFGEYGEGEWNYYSTDDGADEVISYYRDKMPGAGWQEEMAVELDAYSMAVWTKDDGDTVAGVSAGDYEEENTGIIIWCGVGLDDGDSDDMPTPTPATPTEGEEPTAEEPVSAATPGEFTWDDMPVYPGAETDEMSWTSVQSADFQMGIRIYTTNDSVDDVADFYRSEMPQNGWDENMFMQAGGMVTGVFTKNADLVGATVIIESDGGVTTFSLQRTQESS